MIADDAMQNGGSLFVNWPMIARIWSRKSGFDEVQIVDAFTTTIGKSFIVSDDGVRQS